MAKTTDVQETGEMAVLSDALFSSDDVVTPLEMVAVERRKPAKAAAARLFANGVTTVVWIGIALVGAGFGVLAFTWGRVANTVNVGLQLPYVVSGGISSIALIVVGATLINAAVKRQDATARERQISELRTVLEDIRSSVSGS